MQMLLAVRRRRVVGFAATLALAAVISGCGGSGSGSGSGEFVAADAVTTVASSRYELSTPAIASDRTGRDVYVAWTTYPDEEHAASHLAVSHDGGRTFTTRHRLGGSGETYVTEPSLAVTDDGTLYVAWTNLDLDLLIDPSDPYSNAAWQVIARSDDRGRTLSAPVAVPTSGERKAGYYLTIAASSRPQTVTVSWFDYTPSYFRSESKDLAEGAPFYAATSHDGGRRFGPAARLDDHVCVCCQAAGFVLDGHPGFVLRGLARGNLRNPTTIISKDQGDRWWPPVKIREEDYHLPVCPHVGFGAGVDAENVLHVAWWTGGPGVAGVWYTTSRDGLHYGEPLQLEKLAVAPHEHGVTLAVDGHGTSWIATIDPVEGAEAAGEPSLRVWAVPADGDPVAVAGAEEPGGLPKLAAGEDRAYLLWARGSKLFLRRLEDRT